MSRLSLLSMPCPGYNLSLPSHFWKKEQKPRDWPPLTIADAAHSSAEGGLSPSHPPTAGSRQITPHLPPVGQDSAQSLSTGCPHPPNSSEAWDPSNTLLTLPQR